jgi:hypothetical protein
LIHARTACAFSRKLLRDLRRCCRCIFINTRRRLGGWGHKVDIHFISHAFAALTASCCASSTFDLGVHRAWRKRDLQNHYHNIPARGGNQVFGQRHTRPLGGSATTSSTRSSTHCARTVSNLNMWLVHLCCVIVSFLVNMLFLKIKSGLFIIRLFFQQSKNLITPIFMI